MEDLTALPSAARVSVVSNPSPDAEPRLVAFLKTRLKTVLHEQGIPGGSVRAVLSGTRDEACPDEAMAKRSLTWLGPGISRPVTGLRRVGS